MRWGRWLAVGITGLVLLTGCTEDSRSESAPPVDSRAAVAEHTQQLISDKVQVIEDISGWEHPTKNVFERNGLKLKKVELTRNSTYPTFFLSTDPGTLLTDPILHNDIAAANGYWNYTIVYADQYVEVYADQARKLLSKLVTPEETIDLLLREENGNGNNDGYTIRYGNRIVFSDQNGGVYRSDMDGSHLVKLSDDYAENMSIHGNDLFYSNNESIYRLNISSGDQTVVFSGSNGERIQWLGLYQDQLYLVNGKLQVMDLQGNNRMTLLKEAIILSPQIIDDWLLYASRDSSTDRYTIYRFDLETRKQQVVLQGIDDLYAMQQYQDHIYYLTRTRTPNEGECICQIQRTSLDGSNPMNLHSFAVNVHSMNAAGDWIYYVRRDAAQYEVIARINLHNPEQEEVLPAGPTYRMLGEWKAVQDPDVFDSPGELNIAGNWLYYFNVYGHNSYLQALRLPN